MSKTNIKKPKFNGRCDRFWRNKIRLYLVLHGVNLYNWSPCRICRHGEKLGQDSHFCKKIFVASRWVIKKDFSEIKKGLGEKDAGYFCMEWIKDV